MVEEDWDSKTLESRHITSYGNKAESEIYLLWLHVTCKRVLFTGAKVVENYIPYSTSKMQRLKKSFRRLAE